MSFLPGDVKRRSPSSKPASESVSPPCRGPKPQAMSTDGSYKSAFWMLHLTTATGAAVDKSHSFFFFPGEIVFLQCICKIIFHICNFLDFSESLVQEERLWGTISEENVALYLLRQENSLIFSCQTTGCFNNLSLLKPQPLKSPYIFDMISLCIPTHSF